VLVWVRSGDAADVQEQLAVECAGWAEVLRSPFLSEGMVVAGDD
jgi:hypothetical protein